MAAACRCGAVLRGAAVCVPSVWKGTQPVRSAAPGQDGPAKPGAAQRLRGRQPGGSYKGVPADKLDLAYGYIPRGDIEETTDGRTGPDPELAYAGDPAAGLGFYCFAQPVAQGANAYLAAQGSALRAVDITGVTGQGLLQYLRGGDPVIVWITKDLSAPRTGGCTWLLADTGETYAPYVNLHCVVLAGWDGDTCTIADPLQGRRRVDAAAFLQCFRQMGSRAVVVH